MSEVIQSTIEQHVGNHPTTGLPIVRLVEVVTEIPGDGDRSWAEDLHDARVAYESLDADSRARARDWLCAHCHDGIDEIDAYRRAVTIAGREALSEEADPRGDMCRASGCGVSGCVGCLTCGCPHGSEVQP